MNDAAAAARPAWQTDELEDEWIDQETSDDTHPTASIHAHSTSDISFTQPLGSVIVRHNTLETDSPTAGQEAGGTFLIRDDVPAAPFLPKTPGRAKKAFGKDFFSPLALERMFEPPSPPANKPAPLPAVPNTAPAVPSRLSQVQVPSGEETEILEDFSGGDLGDQGEECGLGVEGGVLDCQFTFEAPRPSPFNPNGVVPTAQSTPGHPRMHSAMLNPPSTDPRLRLFQFQYDTFTRDHLSAMVDSIAVNTPSAGSGAATTTGHTPSSGLSPVREVSSIRMRSAKRIKLSPGSGMSSRSGDGIALIHRPKRKDYVGESKSLMDKIRRARDFSTVSTVASARSPGLQDRDSSPEEPEDNSVSPAPPDAPPPSLEVSDANGSRAPSSIWTAASSRRGVYSSLGYREQAANLMAQIRSDMKGSKRIFSEDTEPSHLVVDEPSRREKLAALPLVPSTRRGSLQVRDAEAHGALGVTRGKRKLSPPRYDTDGDATDVDVNGALADGVTHMSLDSQRLLAQFPDPPVRLTVTAEDAPPAPASPRPGIQSQHRPEPNPTFLAPTAGGPPAYPSSSLRGGRNEDLTRFVSSSTASGTTLTQGSAASFVKHPGPKQIMRIAPEDVPALPDRVGKMVFDKVMMKWVKDTAAATAGMAEAEQRLAVDSTDGNESEDPFRDIESLREDDSSGQQDNAQVVIEREPDEGVGDDSLETAEERLEDVHEDTDVEDEEEIELTSFSFDAPSIGEGPYDDASESELTELDSEDAEEEVTDTTELSVPTDTMSDGSDGEYDTGPPSAASRPPPALQDTPPHHLIPQPYVTSAVTTPNAVLPAGAVPTPNGTLRSAMKSSSITPVSAMKDPNRSKVTTPAARLMHRRSVSFSDGKRDGPIRGIGRNVPTPDGTEGTEDEDDSPLASGASRAGSVFVPSARSKRIAEMLDNLEDPALDDESPSKASTSGRPPTEELQPLKARRPSSAKTSPSREVSRRVFSRPHSKTPSTAARNANTTFLTECSFGVAHDRLVQVITDVQPFEPYWEDLTSIDLSAHNIDSVARLKEFLPRLDSLTLNHNQLSWLSGIPGTVRSLSVTHNVLTGLTSFGHLLNIEYLDLSRNQIDSLRQLACLRHLRELRADGNRIDSVDGLQKMDGLVKLSLQGNCIRNIDLQEYHWTRLEMLNVSHNGVSTVSGLGSLPALVALNLDNNTLDELDLDGTMPRLRILRVSGNRLKQLDASAFPGLRTLYADNNYLGTIHKAHRLTKLENLSLRNQAGKSGLSLSLRDVRDVKRLYLSGNPLKEGFIPEPCYNLVYLELAACRLTALPAGLARLIPNVRVLNLNYNFVEDPRPLEGLTRLRKLTLIGSRVKHARLLVRVLRGMTDIEMLDFRMNPCTLGWYLPLLVRDVPGALQPSDGDGPGALVAPRGPASQVGAVPTPRIQSGQRARGGPNSHDAPPEQGSSSTRTGSSSSGSGATSRDAEAAGASGGHGAGAAGPPDAGASASAPGAATWKELDAKFRRDLPDEAYVGRLAYRGLVMRACPAIHLLDGVETSAKEREKAEKLLASLGLGRDRVRGTGANAGAPASDGGTSATGDTAGGFTREKEKTKEGPRARVQ